jgi:hypothetical protein
MKNPDNVFVWEMIKLMASICYGAGWLIGVIQGAVGLLPNYSAESADNMNEAREIMDRFMKRFKEHFDDKEENR